MIELSVEHQASLLDLVRRVIRSALSGDPLDPGEAPTPRCGQPAGCFVSLHRSDTHELRGCIGRLDANQPLWQAVAFSAQGVLEDPRFAQRPVTLAELPELTVEISLLSPLAPAAHVLDFEPAREGIYLVFGNRSGCFLPQVARETGWTREQLLDRLCTEKLALSPLILRNPHAKLFKFTATIVGPAPMVQ